MDRTSTYRVARLSLFPPHRDGGNYRYALIATVVKKGIPTTQILADGLLPAGQSHPSTEAVLEAMDAALRQWMLPDQG